MAAEEPGEIDSRVPVILRIKRRRHGDAADTLVVSHAKLRKLQEEGDVTSQEVCGHGKSVFHFAGTLGSHEASSSHVVLQKVTHQLEHKTKVKHNPFAKLTISDKRQQAKEEQKMLAAQCRYKLVAKNRGLIGESVAGTRDHFQADSGKDHKADLRITGKGASHSKSNFKDYVRQMVELYDLVEEGAGRVGGGEHSSQETEKEEREASLLCETITCNGTEMVRERVAKVIGQGADGQAGDEDEEDFVYDVYYSEERPDVEMEQLYDWSSLTAIPESELVHDILESDEDNLYEDEDDSNDEDNWRNDYPDEERDSDASSDSLGRSDDEDICRYHSHRRHWPRGADFGDNVGLCGGGRSSPDNWYVANADRLGAVVMEHHRRADSLDDEDDEYRDCMYS